jgi:hypothetical protein
MVMAQRFRFVIAEDNPTLVWFDQDLWVANLDYARRKPKQSLESFRKMRAENYELLSGLQETTFERIGNHTRNGPMTLRQLLEGGANHAESHARQMQAVREAYRQAKGK